MEKGRGRRPSICIICDTRANRETAQLSWIALPQVRLDEAKYSVVRAEGIFDGVVAFVHRSRHPKVGTVGNGHHENLSPLQREMSGRARRARAVAPTLIRYDADGPRSARPEPGVDVNDGIRPLRNPATKLGLIPATQRKCLRRRPNSPPTVRADGSPCDHDTLGSAFIAPIETNVQRLASPLSRVRESGATSIRQKDRGPASIA